MSFMAMHGHTSPHHLPAIDEAILILFVTHCTMNLRLAHTTIKTYLCGVRNLYIEANHGNPLVKVHGQALEKLTLVLRGIKKSQSPNTNRRLPITAPILSALFPLLTGSFFSPFLDALLKASCAMAFFAFLRCGEFTCTGHFDSATQFTLSDISFILHSGIISEARLFLKASKTDPFRHGHIIPLFALSSSLCPIQALQHYLHFCLQLNRNPMSPLLTLQDGSPLSRTRFISMLQCALRSLGLQSAVYWALLSHWRSIQRSCKHGARPPHPSSGPVGKLMLQNLHPHLVRLPENSPRANGLIPPPAPPSAPAFHGRHPALLLFFQCNGSPGPQCPPHNCTGCPCPTQPAMRRSAQRSLAFALPGQACQPPRPPWLQRCGARLT